MRKALCLLLLLPLFIASHSARAAGAAQDAAKIVQPTQPAAAATLSNRDVVEMVGAKTEAEIILAKIKASDSNFDTSPDALRQLKADGVPDEIILAMIFANDGRLAASRLVSPSASAEKFAVKVPGGTIVEIETAYDISSQQVRAGDAISFRVVNPVKVNGAVVVAPGATATARIVKASRGGHFGRAGRLAWNMIEVTAVDGSRIPIQLSGRAVGDSKGAKVAARTVVTGLLLGPAAPLALLHGFKRGENAVIPQGKRFEVTVQGDASVQARPAAQPR